MPFESLAASAMTDNWFIVEHRDLADDSESYRGWRHPRVGRFGRQLESYD